jgi:elongator complex protein 1
MQNLSLQGERRHWVDITKADVGTSSVRWQVEGHVDVVGISYFAASADELGFVGTQRDAAILTRGGLLLRVDSDDQIVWIRDLNEVVAQEGDQVDAKDDTGWFAVNWIDPHLVCMTRSGAIVTISTDAGEASLVGAFENGIHCAAWSPDNEILLLVTLGEPDDEGSESHIRPTMLLSMNAQWEVLSETSTPNHVLPGDGADSDPSTVSVCWKPDGTLAAMSSVDVVDQTRRIRIFRRSTLELSAVGLMEDGSGRFVPNIQPTMAWASSGCSQALAAVQSKGRSTQVIFFEPNGLRHREFNLRKQDTDESFVVTGLAFNSLSDLLAVTLRCGARSEPSNPASLSFRDRVQLWHRSNYHWYLKKEFRYDERHCVTHMRFGDDPYSFIVMLSPSRSRIDGETCSDVHWREYHVKWDTSWIHQVSPAVHQSELESGQEGLTPKSGRDVSCTAFVVDGTSLGVTPFHRALVPPPLHAGYVTLPCPVSEIALNSHRRTFKSSSSTIAATCVALLSDGSFCVVAKHTNPSTAVSETVPGYSPPKVLCTVTWPSNDSRDVTSFRNPVIVASKPGCVMMAVVCGGKRGDQNEVLIDFRIDFEGGKADLIVGAAIPLADRALALVPWVDEPLGALVELSDGSLLEYQVDATFTGSIVSGDAVSMMEPCPWLVGLRNACRHGDDRGLLAVGRSARGRLYCRDVLIADSVSSFVLTPHHEFLCYSTSDSQCQLRFVSLRELQSFDPLSGSDSGSMLSGFEPRRIERGAQLVAILPGEPGAVLQMPRGNLEGIYPRALAVRYVIERLRRGDYGNIFVLMRRHKLDLNLIVDLDPSRFLSQGVAALLKQVTMIDHLNLFISSLQNYDSATQRFTIPLWLRSIDGESSNTNQPFEFSEKVNVVCQEMRAAMSRLESGNESCDPCQVRDGHYLLPILTTFAKEDPPRLEEALSRIKTIALNRKSSVSAKSPILSEEAQANIQYLAFLADYEMLFETALGMYDYDLARAILRNSQMDPKKFLPQLRRYCNLPEFYGRYEVDLRLKRYSAALSNLYESNRRQEPLETTPVADLPNELSNSFDSCMRFMETHSLHQIGLQLFQSDEEKRSILLSLGDSLLRKKQPRQALNVFLAVTPVNLDQVKRAARACFDWRTYFSCSIASDGKAMDANERLRLVLTAREFAEEILNGAGSTEKERRRSSVDAARVLMDYGDDFSGACDLLNRAEMWSESYRLARLHGREDLAQRCVDAAISYSHATIADLEERAESFVKANTRFTEVLQKRNEAIAAGDYEEEMLTEHDDSGSIFSSASNLSSASLRSVGSSNSASSLGSVSTVVSVRSSASSFKLSGSEGSMRHKSKYNKISKEVKSKKKKNKGRSRVQPGSRQELIGLAESLKNACVDLEYCQVVADTVRFLHQVQRSEMARALFDSYVALQKTVEESQIRRRDEKESEAIGQQQTQIHFNPGVEVEVGELKCAPLPEELHVLLGYITSGIGMVDTQH